MGYWSDPSKRSMGFMIQALASAVLLFGAGRLADIGKGLGQGIKNFKHALKEDETKAAEEKKQA